MGEDPAYKVFLFFKTRLHYVALGPEISLSSRDPPGTASSSTGFKGKCHQTWYSLQVLMLT